jgi:hypothetical protein
MVTTLVLSILMYVRYVDDITILTNIINQCWLFNTTRNKMEHNHLRSETGVSNETHTFKVLQDIANSINIQMTVDVPGNHPDNRMPVLDLKVWVSHNASGVPMVCHTFYKKPVSSPYSILSCSAMSASVKRHTLFQKALRRLLNVDPSQPWAEKAWHLSAWGNMLRVSGYSDKY